MLATTACCRSDPNSRMLSRPAILLAACALALAACTSPSETAGRIAGRAGLERAEIATGTFRLTSYRRLNDASAPVVVYIEGDGLAWKSRSEPSRDPTPREAVGLRLAAEDPSANVVYLARPCQFTKGDRACTLAYWTSHRFAPEVIDSLSEAIDRTVQGRPVHLVGYSGGGAIAALLAERRSDVLSLRTVAGNLDHEALNRYHGVSSMPLSLNAMSGAAALRGLAQVHYVGDADKIVPAFIANDFVAAQGGNTCASVVIVPGASHDSGWSSFWAHHAVPPPTCR